MAAADCTGLEGNIAASSWLDWEGNGFVDCVLVVANLRSGPHLSVDSQTQVVLASHYSSPDPLQGQETALHHLPTLTYIASTFLRTD